MSRWIWIKTTGHCMESGQVLHVSHCPTAGEWWHYRRWPVLLVIGHLIQGPVNVPLCRIRMSKINTWWHYSQTRPACLLTPCSAPPWHSGSAAVCSCISAALEEGISRDSTLYQHQYPLSTPISCVLWSHWHDISLIYSRLRNDLYCVEWDVKP